MLSADLASRLQEDHLHRSPKTIVIYHGSGANSKSRQTLVPHGKQIDADTLFRLGVRLMQGVESEGHAYPCYRLALALTGFEEDGATKNQTITNFFTKNTASPTSLDASTLNQPNAASSSIPQPAQPAPIRKNSITRFFRPDTLPADILKPPASHSTILCSRCGDRINQDQRQEHDDMHFAADLQGLGSDEEFHQSKYRRTNENKSSFTAQSSSSSNKSSSKREKKDRSLLEFGLKK